MSALIASERNVDIWLAFYNDIADERVPVRCRTLLNEAERAQEGRFYFADDRRRYLMTRALLRATLSRYAGVAPTEWELATNEYGRPHVVNPQGGHLRFNISHTRGLIAIAIAQHLALGIDVENIGVREVSLGIADHYFAPTEVAALARVPAERQQERFFEYWTFKESYIKARGMGLSIPLDQFSFSFPAAEAVQLRVEPVLNDHGSRWRLWQFRPRAEYLMALCVERGEGRAPSVTVRRAIPTVSDELLEMCALRTSEARMPVIEPVG